MPCTRHHSQYLYHASAYAVAAEFERPRKHSLPPQASVVLSAHGGHGTNRAAGQSVDGLISFKEAYSEVGGSYDDCHDIYTTYAWTVLEGVNVADVLIADRVVSRVAIYTPADGKKEPSFDFTGSHFENLRIAGHRVDVELATQDFHNHDTYSALATAHENRSADHLLLGHGFCEKAGDLKRLENEYHALKGMSQFVDEWNKKEDRPKGRDTYRLSAANCPELERQLAKTELECYGSFVCVPKFGVIRLGEILVEKYRRSLLMLRVQMCSSGRADTSTGSSSGSGGGTLPGG